MSTPIKTSGNSTFGIAGHASKRQRLFAVADGVDAADALQCASNWLDMVSDALHDVGMGEPLSPNNAFLLQHAIDSAKAAVDAVQCGLECATEQGGGSASSDQ